MDDRYWGSVRFFKNLILLAIIVSIVVPSGLSVHFGRELTAARREMASLPDRAVSAETGGRQTQSIAYSNAADVPLYESLYPDFYCDEPLTANQSSSKTIFLTFDDGPSKNTPKILEILKSQGVQATFFVVGKTDAQSLQNMRDIVAQGHTIGMHSYSHNYKQIYASVDAFLADLYQLFCLIRDTTGVKPSVFRMPGGSINAYDYDVYQEILAEMLRRGFVPCDWNLSSGDATGSAVTKAQILSNVVGRAGSVNRGFVLMHDAAGKETTVSALSDMITDLRAKGFSFARLTPDVKPVLFSYSN